MRRSRRVPGHILRSLALSVSSHGEPTDLVDFQCPGQALGIIGMDSCRGLRVHHRHFPMQSLPAVTGCAGFQLRAHRGIGAGHVRQPFQQRFEIQHGAADQQRNLAPGGDFLHGGEGIGTELCG
ncbi:hypothetical protein D9M68_972770 [compost metagenome]